MAKVKCKGTVLQQDIASTLTDIAQIISIELPEAENETYEADTLDNSGAGIPYELTGRTEGGSVSFEMFFDPALAGHQEFTDKLTTPADDSYKIIFADSGTTEWAFTGSGVSLGGTVDLADGLKANVTIKVDGIVTYPT